MKTGISPRKIWCYCYDLCSTITSSFGIATRATNEHTSYEELLVAADKALYVSKNSGRNRVSVYHPSAAGEAPAQSQPPVPT